MNPSAAGPGNGAASVRHSGRSDMVQLSRKPKRAVNVIAAVREFHRPFPVRPRLLSYEKADSYLRELLSANQLSPDMQSELTRQARTVDPGVASEDIPALIAKVKGQVDPHAFLRARDAVPIHSDGITCPRCIAGIEQRYMCRLCSAGRAVEQYPHLKANVCRQHHLWIGPGTAPATQVKVGSAAVKADLVFQRLRNQGVLDALRYMELRAIFRRWDGAGRTYDVPFGQQEPTLYPLMMAVALSILRPAALWELLDPRKTFASAYDLLHRTLSKQTAENTDVLSDGFWLLLRPAFLAVREQFGTEQVLLSADPHAIQVPDFPESVTTQVFRPLEPFSRYMDQLRTCDVNRWRNLNQRLYDFGPLPVIHESVPESSSAPANYICAKGHRHQKAPNLMAAAMKQGRVGCPYCTNALPLAGYNTLAETHPALAAQWHPTLNGAARPSDVTAGGNSKKYWWQCPLGHSYQDSPNNRSRINGTNCPYCTGRRVIPGITSLDVTHPALAREWHTELNGDLIAAMVSAGSAKKAWWLCPNKHAYRAEINQRARTGSPSGCPYCANRKLLVGYNDLRTTHPELAAEWHPTLNAGLSPTDIVAGTGRKIWWQCPAQHAYESAASSRVSGRGCPYCANVRIWQGFNDLETLAPNVAAQWDHARNSSLTPAEVGAGSPRKAWWLCPLGHSFQSAINQRFKGSGCPYCSDKRVLPGFNDLPTRYPALATEWHPTKNGPLLPSMVLPGNNKRWWLCSDGHEQHMTVSNRLICKGCSLCPKAARTLTRSP